MNTIAPQPAADATVLSAPFPEEVWQHLSPLQWAHIHLNGSYHFTDVELEGDFRPLREYHGSRARLAPRLESVERDAGLLQEEEDVLPLQLSLLGEDEKDRCSRTVLLDR